MLILPGRFICSLDYWLMLKHFQSGGLNISVNSFLEQQNQLLQALRNTAGRGVANSGCGQRHSLKCCHNGRFVRTKIFLPFPKSLSTVTWFLVEEMFHSKAKTVCSAQNY